MINEIDPPIQAPRSTHPMRQDLGQLPNSVQDMSSGLNPRHPVIEVSECDGNFNVYADFRPVLDSSTAQVVVKFAQQGLILAGGAVQRYLPIPTDALILYAQVTTADGIARISIPTADSGHRWRSIVMW